MPYYPPALPTRVFAVVSGAELGHGQSPTGRIALALMVVKSSMYGEMDKAGH
jgi:hypothetical protein